MQFAALGGNTGESGPRFKPAEHEGRLLLIEPIAYRTDIPTDKGPAEAVEAHVVDLDSNEKYDNALLFGVALRNDLRNLIGQKALARLGKGQAKNGKTPAWVLTDARNDSEAVKKVTAYFANGLAAPAAPAPAAPAPAAPKIDVNSLDAATIALLQSQLGAQKVS